jgi:hypothetical protein
MMPVSALVAKSWTLFEDFLAPLVNGNETLLLFATFVFHHHYFGAANAVTDFFALSGAATVGVYVYGLLVLLANLVTIPPDWHAFTALMVYLGNALISVAYTSLFWLQMTTPSWQELLVQLYYVLQAVLSLILVILLLTQGKDSRFYVTPRLCGSPGLLKTLLILAYVGGMTVLLDRGFGVTPDAVTAQVNLYGTLALEVVTRVRTKADF